MPTVAKVVTRALRLLRVIDANAAPSAADTETGLEALNSMMRRWEANGLALGWATVDNVADEMPAPEEAEEAIVYNLAVRLRAEYGTPIDPDVVQMASDGLALLRRDRAVAVPLRYRTPRGDYDIRTDSYC